MGQRLTIQICYDGDPLVTSYEHWSGYTYSALIRTKLLLEAIDTKAVSSMSADECHRYATRLLVDTLDAVNGGGAGIVKDDIIYMLNRFGPELTAEFHEAKDRNAGLVAISPRHNEELFTWGEACVIVDLESAEADIANAFFYLEREEVEKEVADGRVLVELGHSLGETMVNEEFISWVLDKMDEEDYPIFRYANPKTNLALYADCDEFYGMIG